jgi:hypothetical protein
MDWYKKGDRISWINSVDTGIITKILDTDLVLVRLDADQTEIPAFIEDIEPYHPGALNEIKSEKVTLIKEPSDTLKLADASIPRSQSEGMLLAFVPIAAQRNEETDTFQPYLINATSYSYSFSIRLHLKLFKAWEESGKLDGGSFTKLSVFKLAYFNESPELVFVFNRISTEGPGPEIPRKLRLKAKTFFQDKQKAPIIHQPAHIFEILENRGGFEADSASGKISLKEYTLENATPLTRKKEPIYGSKNSVKTKSEFSIELDLHIEKLTEDPGKISGPQIIHIQMKSFEAYLEEAIRQGVERVFIIHGIGKGHLRNLITASLMRNPGVLTFRNEYHPRYGHGATEVIFI